MQHQHDQEGTEGAGGGEDGHLLSSFREWCLEKGVKLNPCLDIVWHEDRYQIRAVGDIGAEEAMLEVPRRAMITEQDVISHVQPKIVEPNNPLQIVDTFTLEQQIMAQQIVNLGSTQLVDRILQMRQGGANNNNSNTHLLLESSKQISKRSLFLSFLLDPTDDFRPFCQILPKRTPNHPIHWSKDELLLLTKSPTGLVAVQQTAATVAVCLQEYQLLCSRDDKPTFTLEQYLRACSVYQSYSVTEPNAADTASSTNDKKANGSNNNSFTVATNASSSPHMVPLLDMMKPSVRGGHTVTWKPELARMVVVRNISSNQFPCRHDGPKDNLCCITQYGMSIWKNSNDTVKIGWTIGDAVGGNSGGTIGESRDEALKHAWWTSDRLDILQKRLSSDVPDMTRHRLIVFAKADKTYHEDLLTAAVVATMDPAAVVASRGNLHKSKTLYVTRKHQTALREYLTNFFTGKMEKLLQSLDKHWKDHFPEVQLWTKVSEGGGLDYVDPDGASGFQGWNAFLESRTTMQDSQLAIGPLSATLTLVDGSLRALQQSLTGLVADEKFENRVLRQLTKLKFKILRDDDIPEGGGEEDEEGEDRETSGGGGEEMDETSNGKSSSGRNNSGKSSKSSRKRNRKRPSSTGSGGGGVGGGGNSDRAMKLHIGNLAYSTQASDLFEYFASLYDRENVLECHIPTERDTGRSRGYGFVTMPEPVSQNALSKKHEVHGRLLKVAESNSAGAANRNRGPSVNAVAESDRCARCGYSPRYCGCPVPDIPAFNGHAGRGGPPPPPPPYHDHMRPPPPDMGPYGRDAREFDYYGGNYRRDNRGDSPGRHRGSRGFRDMRDYDRDYHYRRSRSRSYSRGRDRSRDRDRYRYRERSLSRDRSRNRRSGRYHSRRRRSRSRSVSTDRSSSASRRRDRREESASRNKTPAEGEPLKRSSRRRSRSRSRGRREKRKRSSKKDGKKHERRSRSRSRSQAD